MYVYYFSNYIQTACCWSNTMKTNICSKTKNPSNRSSTQNDDDDCIWRGLIRCNCMKWIIFNETNRAFAKAPIFISQNLEIFRQLAQLVLILWRHMTGLYISPLIADIHSSLTCHRDWKVVFSPRKGEQCSSRTSWQLELFRTNFQGTFIRRIFRNMFTRLLSLEGDKSECWPGLVSTLDLLFLFLPFGFLLVFFGSSRTF